ncbi:MAG: 16S rRNA (cytosine(1402)-N(4))-methyltransferase RsmH [Candidatus Scalindua sp. AMX11]|nr:MAG: 16S rRNA (cytosine(1402)-N(4))-methyltransferase RsmH [Candidatus Scalindua sp.]NOG85597.1 16S rRNA (cytosine(1402)-N(4))-methyltransferase RsmH [Planctomycetota bacterium]RZV65364.1 MAG: 16S rRNA (cytosine(1402)-N(4))-methyltransferase RsmH [Candidatus Scalindua sp. SCAELEC01]TDE63482.1 MAG: 16S rRNA (cytosine(1402)-N(4))-methyltransferase RsmH [Candidatus Scalindua sp. AMX11]GJQ57301.1 MAG: ribosomal RNA small subunit methyltransferase H [Candidatus Scalindua sp.]
MLLKDKDAVQSECFDEEQAPHIPVMLEEVMSFLKPGKGDIIVDTTIGAGGHSREILKCIGSDGLLIGIDKDADILKIARQHLSDIGNPFRLYHADYADLGYILEELKIEKVKGILLDLGVSSYQLDVGERGFSFRKEAPLDMRMDQSRGVTASELLRRLSEKEMIEIFWRYGEERGSRRIAKAIIKERRANRPIETTTQLAKIIEKAVCTSGKYQQRGRIHVATKVFQALRIVVNDELKSLEFFLNHVHGFLEIGSRVVALSFHSLEDRLAKNAFRKGDSSSTLKILTKKPLLPSDTEISENARSRSAKLRAAERI